MLPPCSQTAEAMAMAVRPWLAVTVAGSAQVGRMRGRVGVHRRQRRSLRAVASRQGVGLRWKPWRTKQTQPLAAGHCGGRRPNSSAVASARNRVHWPCQPRISRDEGRTAVVRPRSGDGEMGTQGIPHSQWTSAEGARHHALFGATVFCAISSQPWITTQRTDNDSQIGGRIGSGMASVQDR